MNEQKISAILKVREQDYIPAKVALRMKISKFIYTVNLLESDADIVRQDPNVESLVISERIPLQKLPNE